MERQRIASPIILIQYFLIGLFALHGMAGLPRFSPLWWFNIPLALALGVLITFWPTRRGYAYAYLTGEAALLIALTCLSPDFMFLGITFGPPAFLLLPLRSAVIVVSSFTLVLEIIVAVSSGLNAAFYPGLAQVIATYTLGYVYYLRERAEENHHKTQALLDKLREAHHKLEAYAAQVQELTAAEERNRLARELHDSVKQQAFAASAQLGAARSLLESNPPAARDHLLKAEALLDEVRGELNQLIYELRPPVLQNRGLPGALREWGAGWSQQSGIPLTVRVEGEYLQPPETGQSLFRISQEALSNIARHSRAHSAEIHLEYGPERLILSICDDGQGFDPANPGDGIGLKTMRERAERLPGGQFEVTSTPSSGTQIKITCIVHPTQDGNAPR